ncbi:MULTISPECIES: serine protease [Micromonospora]|uniref:serine protease n=1 Tax=Micromonospora TaxID=1873 RepID=UPI0033F85CE1
MTAGATNRQHVEITAGTGYGTGYLLAPRLVLTARHVAPAGNVMVRCGLEPDAGWLPATVVWAGSGGLDAALLELREPAPILVHPPRFGLITRHPQLPVARVKRPHTCRCFGFPALQKGLLPDGSEYRDTVAVTGTVRDANLRSRLITVDVDSIEVTAGRDWKGISGAPLFAGGHLVGVVCTTEPRRGQSLDAVPVAAMLGAEQASITDFRASNTDRATWNSVLTRHDVSTSVEAAHRRPSKATLDWYAEQHHELIGREAEIHRFRQWLPSGGYAVWSAAPWAGKTALATALAARPPADVDVVFHFVSRNQGSADGYQVRATLVEQLAALLDEEPPTPTTQAFHDLLAAAAETERVLGRRLLLLVDGLDELAERSDVETVLNLLPATLPAAVSVALFLRPIVNLATLLDNAAHALADPLAHDQVSLAPSDNAKQSREQAEHHLADIYDHGGPAKRALECIAAAGPLAVGDLVAALSLNDDGEDELTQALARAPMRRILVPIPATGAVRFAFAHNTLREWVLQHSSKDPAVYQRALADAGTRWAEAGWPDRTPDFYVSDYPHVLSRLGEVKRLAEVVLAPAWLALLRRRSRTNPSPSDVLGRVLLESGDVSRAQWPVLVEIGMRLQTVAPRLESYPAPLVHSWALAGDTGRARRRAQQMIDPQIRARTQFDLAWLLHKHGQHPEAVAVLQQSAQSAAAIDVESTDERSHASHKDMANLSTLATQNNPHLPEPAPSEEPEAAAGIKAGLLARIGFTAWKWGQMGPARDADNAVRRLLAEPVTGHLTTSVLLDAARLALALGDVGRAQATLQRLDDAAMTDADRRMHLQLAAACDGTGPLPAPASRPEEEPFADLEESDTGDLNVIRLRRIRATLARGDIGDAARMVEEFEPVLTGILDFCEDWAVALATVAHEAARRFARDALPVVEAAERYAQQHPTIAATAGWRPHVQSGLHRANDFMSEPAGTFLAEVVKTIARAGRFAEATAAARLDGRTKTNQLLLAAFAVGTAQAGQHVTAARLLAGVDTGEAMESHFQIALTWIEAGRWRDAIGLMARYPGYNRTLVNARAAAAAIRAGAVHEGMALVLDADHNPFLEGIAPVLASDALADIGYADVAHRVLTLVPDKTRRLFATLRLAGRSPSNAADLLPEAIEKIDEVQDAKSRFELWIETALVARRLENEPVYRSAGRRALLAAYRLDGRVERCKALLSLVPHADSRNARRLLSMCRTEDAVLGAVAAAAYDAGHLDIADDIIETLLARPQPWNVPESLIRATAQCGRIDIADRLLSNLPVRPRISRFLVSTKSAHLSEVARIAARCGLWERVLRTVEEVPEPDRPELLGELAAMALDEPSIARTLVVRGFLSGMHPRLLAAATRLNPDVGPQAVGIFVRQATQWGTLPD